MKKILLWGAGERTKHYLDSYYFKNCELIGIVDSYKKGKLCGCVIYPREWALKMVYDYLIICVGKFAEIMEWCISHRIEFGKILITDYINEEPFVQKWKILEKIEPQFGSEKFAFHRYQRIKMNEKDFLDDSRLTGRGHYGTDDYMMDYYRYRTFEYVADEIISQHVPGQLAEFGVFKGVFSSLISKKIPEKKIYLFDTFEGFDAEEAKKELAEGNCSKDFITAHTETSVKTMLENMPHAEQCVICKGFFPASVTRQAAEEQYAFVSIDVDFEESIYQGLKFFYQRLSDGGAIFIHDYNSAYLKGVKKAVKRYEAENHMRLKKVPLADRAGTLVILK